MTIHADILERLRIDPGKRTLGELLQDREAAVHEIRKLRADIEGLLPMRGPRQSRKDGAEGLPALPAVRRGMLIRLADVCEMVGVAGSTVYKWVAEGTFPAPVRISGRAVRWRIDEIEAWGDRLQPGGARVARQ